jgi:hypothetical protein
LAICSTRWRRRAPCGFVGWHELELWAEGDGTLLRHTLTMNAVAPALLVWPLAIRCLHFLYHLFLAIRVRFAGILGNLNNLYCCTSGWTLRQNYVDFVEVLCQCRAIFDPDRKLKRPL